jgi:hypothetical protein
LLDLSQKATPPKPPESCASHMAGALDLSAVTASASAALVAPLDTRPGKRLVALLAQYGWRLDPLLLSSLLLLCLAAALVALGCCCCCRSSRKVSDGSQQLLPTHMQRSDANFGHSSVSNAQRPQASEQKAVTISAEVDEGGRGGGWGDLDSFEELVATREEHPTTRRDPRLAKYGLGEPEEAAPPMNRRGGPPAPAGPPPGVRRGPPENPRRGGGRR